MNLDELERYRVLKGFWYSKPGDEFGVFNIPFKSHKLRVVCAPMDSEWQHVSVSLKNRCPNWDEMSFIKDLFWGEEQTVVQFHPKKDAYVDNHPNCLHLWRKKDTEYELPPSIYVGIKGLEKLEKKDE